MAKSNHLVILCFFTLIISACGTKESLQRDLGIISEMKLAIAPSSNLTDTTQLAELKVNSDLSTVITENTPEFSVVNLRSVHINGLRLSLDSEIIDGEPVVDVVNNLKAFDYIRVQIKSQNEKLLDLGSVSGGSIVSTTALQIPLSNSAGQELVKYFRDGTLTYIITGIYRTETTEVMKVSATATYKLTLGI